MLRTTLLLIAFASSLAATAQNVEELERRNGFKDLKLGMHIDSVKGEKKFKKDFKEQDEFDAKIYTVEHPDYESIGEVPVSRVEIKTYKDEVYHIQVVASKDPRLMKALESIYGSSEYDMKKETYFWKGNTLILKFRSFTRNQLEMTFTSYLVLQKMKDDKGKKVEDIADDF
ncbi:MAG TPA: hypothetical protein VFT90_10080 [Chryseosolibacter sp.]|nr:hypothetical protein [Chryseosolibacter sp.]